MQAPSLPLIEFHHPATFESRGVAVPFTSPLLTTARVRPTGRGGIEFLVANPAGGRGVYVLHWRGADALGNPTLHDTVLYQRLSRLPRIDPAGVRGAALEVALEGYAGQAAAAAAAAVMTSDHTQRLLAHVLLVTRLIDQMEPDGQKPGSLAERLPGLDQRASILLHRIAPSLGHSAAHLASGLEAIAGAFVPVGIERDDRMARISRLIAHMEKTQAALSLWLDADATNDIGGLGRTIIRAMTVARGSGIAMLAQTQTILTNPMALLKHWIRDAAGALELASRCDWVLDGWERVCLLWQAAESDGSRRMALLEMAQLLPVLPSQIREWVDAPIPHETMDQTCRIVSHSDTWRTGSSALALIQRNEALRAMST